MTALQPGAALWFAPFVLPICLMIAYSDLARMRIPNVMVAALLLVFVVIGPLALPFETYLWRLVQFLPVLLVGVLLNASGMIGAGDAKFMAAAAPFVAPGDLRLVLVILAANLLGALIAHRLVRATPLRRLAPQWESWSRPGEFPMGLALGATLALYLAAAVLRGG